MKERIGSFFRGKSEDEIVYADIMEKSYAFLVSKLMDAKNVNVINKKSG